MPSLTILGPPLIVNPSVFITVLPVVTLFKPFKSLARRAFKLFVPSDTTPILSSVVNLFTSVMPPTTFTCSLSFFLITAPVSPPYFMPSSNVATSCLSPFFSSITRRVMFVPSTPGLPSPPLMEMPLAPSLPFKPIEPSLPLITTAEPSLPLTPMEPSLPSAPFLPSTRSSFTLTLYGLLAEPSPSTVVFLPSLRIVLPAAIASFN